MNRDQALKMINDLFITPRINEYNFKIIANSMNTPVKSQYENNVKIINELKDYVEANLQ